MAICLYDYWKAWALRLSTSRSDKELPYVNGPPISDAVAPSCFRAPRQPGLQLPEDFGAVDVYAFMERVRALASQI